MMTPAQLQQIQTVKTQIVGMRLMEQDDLAVEYQLTMDGYPSQAIKLAFDELGGRE